MNGIHGFSASFKHFEAIKKCLSSTSAVHDTDTVAFWGPSFMWELHLAIQMEVYRPYGSTYVPRLKYPECLLTSLLQSFFCLEIFLSVLPAHHASIKTFLKYFIQCVQVFPTAWFIRVSITHTAGNRSLIYYLFKKILF